MTTSNGIFNLMEVTRDLVVIKIADLTNYQIATHPYVNGEMDYISVTRGINHIMTIVNKNGKTWSVDWGRDKFTACSSNVEKLRKEVVNFLEKDCYIALDAHFDLKHSEEINVFYNNNTKCWQMVAKHCKEKQTIFYPEAKSIEEVQEKAEQILRRQLIWTPAHAETGLFYLKGVK